MFPTENGSVRLFRGWGVDVWLHWTWAVALMWVVDRRQGAYDSVLWNLAEYVGLFAIVLLHEFGHALACRQIGGMANRIVLWPLGGIAFVSPPARAGAQLWSIAAGPLVNVALAPIFYFGGQILSASPLSPPSDDFWAWLSYLMWVNRQLLLFNLLPIFPLDGGQILRSLLWFVTDERRSLAVASAIGLPSAVLLGVWALQAGEFWLGLVALFLGTNCWRAFQTARIRGN